MKTILDTALISRMTGGLWHDKSEKSEPIKEKSTSISFYGQNIKHENRVNNDISELITNTKLKKFVKEYYSEINPNTGEPQTFEKYLRELISDAKDDLRRGNYFEKEAQLEFLEELESYLTIWQEIKTCQVQSS